MPNYGVNEAANELEQQGFTCSPKLLSDWLYIRKLDVKRCPLVNGRRQIPANYLPQIAAMLRTAGYAVQSPASAT